MKYQNKKRMTVKTAGRLRTSYILRNYEGEKKKCYASQRTCKEMMKTLMINKADVFHFVNTNNIFSICQRLIIT